ncbi:hypothetical protein P9139_09155 [Curtobacterium flaccumfaciens]|nr:hypothetical protein P9139_09155 [Curtobacterium flaccumfaciens]
MPEATADALTITDIASGADAEAFRILNEDWIGRFFTLEDEDRKLLGDPFGRLSDPAARPSSHDSSTTARSSAASASSPSNPACSSS